MTEDTTEDTAIDRDGWSETPDADELLERAWGIIANGPWLSRRTDEWTKAARGFRSAYFAWLDKDTEGQTSKTLDQTFTEQLKGDAGA